MTWKVLSWAIHQLFGTKKGDSIMAALKNDAAVAKVVDLGDSILAGAEADLLKKAGL